MNTDAIMALHDEATQHDRYSGKANELRAALRAAVEQVVKELADVRALDSRAFAAWQKQRGELQERAERAEREAAELQGALTEAICKWREAERERDDNATECEIHAACTRAQKERAERAERELAACIQSKMHASPRADLLDEARAERDEARDTVEGLGESLAYATKQAGEARALLQEALRCMKEAKSRWAPTTTNSDADVCIARIDAFLKDKQ